MNIFAGWKMVHRDDPIDNFYIKGRYVVGSATVKEYWENQHTGKRCMCPITTGKMVYMNSNKFLDE